MTSPVNRTPRCSSSRTALPARVARRQAWPGVPGDVDGLPVGEGRATSLMGIILVAPRRASENRGPVGLGLEPGRAGALAVVLARGCPVRAASASASWIHTRSARVGARPFGESGVVGVRVREQHRLQVEKLSQRGNRPAEEVPVAGCARRRPR